MPSDPIVLECPHCKQLFEIVELNCRIFRCGILKENYTQIPPHSTKDVCDDLKARDLIFGCGKPFRIEKNGDTYISIICDYI